MCEVQFDADQAQTLYSCAEDGAVLRWAFTGGFADDAHVRADSLLTDSLPVNSVNVAQRTLACGSDAGTLSILHLRSAPIA